MKQRLMRGLMIAALVAGVLLAGGQLGELAYGASPTYTQDKMDALDDLPNKNTNYNPMNNILNFAYVVAGVLAVIFLIVAGIQYVTSNGDPAKASKALRMIIYSLAGLAIVVAAAAITNFILSNV